MNIENFPSSIIIKNTKWSLVKFKESSIFRNNIGLYWNEKYSTKIMIYNNCIDIHLSLKNGGGSEICDDLESAIKYMEDIFDDIT